MDIDMLRADPWVPADYGEEQPLWRVLRFCPGDTPLLITIEDEGVPHWVVTFGWRLADARTHGRWIEWSNYGLHAISTSIQATISRPETVRGCGTIRDIRARGGNYLVYRARYPL